MIYGTSIITSPHFDKIRIIFKEWHEDAVPLLTNYSLQNRLFLILRLLCSRVNG
jgi:hypothetical protein